ncbi:MAG TPA: hypothetical protein VHD38_02305 [Candidatus Paceibacterota bacterium]|jgi:hypothetical protein|nr:hypothetical protein [Candidatus Paceibacterota bacterium]
MAQQTTRHKAHLTKGADIRAIKAAMDEAGAIELFTCQHEDAIMFSAKDQSIVEAVRKIVGVKKSIDLADGIVPCNA